MQRQNVNLSRAHQAVHDAVGTPNYFANLGIIELGNGTARIWKRRDLVGGGNQLADDH